MQCHDEHSYMDRAKGDLQLCIHVGGLPLWSISGLGDSMDSAREMDNISCILTAAHPLHSSFYDLSSCGTDAQVSHYLSSLIIAS